MSAMRPQRVKIKPKEEAAYFSSLGKDEDGFNIKYINSFKGRGVFSCRHFQKGDFLIEYRLEIKQEHENRLRLYHDALKVFMFEFLYNGKKLCIDAAREDDSLGRLVNDDHVSPNSRMRIITVDRKPHLCLFAIKDIRPGEEITYNYGDSDWPWRLKVSTEARPHHAAWASDCTKDVKQHLNFHL
ncbi:N-lysine methyltransferase KMT5A-A-like isoform X3 [Thunnus maccoyii]|uniref:N-lysine methyltransferase KMT5A-A-like isoform X3 n=1 Tax=Thunnus maccoyii TaxID=8240 RepID=UPI001C4BEE3E|nr:N-lysine methyltransferase KMT5A-A-like isoform X3 [Thunnus maccoyii]